MRPGQKKQSKKERTLNPPNEDRPACAGGRKKPSRSRKHRHHRKQCRTPEPYDSDSNYDYCGYYGKDYNDNLD